MVDKNVQVDVNSGNDNISLSNRLGGILKNVLNSVKAELSTDEAKRLKTDVQNKVSVTAKDTYNKSKIAANDVINKASDKVKAKKNNDNKVSVKDDSNVVNFPKTAVVEEVTVIKENKDKN